MTTPLHHKSPTGFFSRAAFTLTELLIAITVIAILAGFLAPAVMNAFGTAREATVLFEMKQLELAIEQFKNDKQFYPPTFGPGNEIETWVDLQRYVNKMAPRNRESAVASKFPGTPAGQTRLQTWWLNVGQYLDETTSLQFWLSGLCKNKQYPLTGNVVVDAASGTSGTMTICAFDDNKYSDGTDFPTVPSLLEIERDNYYDFKNKQLVPTQAGDINSAGDTLPGPMAAYYSQAYGESDGDLRFRYLDYKSYGGKAYYNTDGFFNPKGFQIVTFGRDGQSSAMPNATGLDISNPGVDGFDNLTNFAEGRVEKYLNTN